MNHRPHVVDIDRLHDVADSHHLLHQIREQRRRRVVQAYPTVPAALAIELPPRMPAWQRPSPRAGRQLAIAYRRRHHVVRAVCRVLPFLTRLVRAVL